MLHVESVRHLGGYKLRVDFSSGVVKDVDLEEELQGEIFAPLKDPALFGQAFLNRETRTVEWPNGADFAPEFLFEIGITVEQVA